METATTRRRLRSKGTMRRRITNSVKINSDAISAILAPIYNDLPTLERPAARSISFFFLSCSKKNFASDKRGRTTR